MSSSSLMASMTRSRANRQDLLATPLGAMGKGDANGRPPVPRLLEPRAVGCRVGPSGVNLITGLHLVF